MRKFFFTVENEITGNPVSGAIVYCLDAPSAQGGMPVTIYYDDGVTEAAVAGQVTTNDAGYFEFYAADGIYTIEFGYGGEVRKVIEDVQIATIGTAEVAALGARLDVVEAVTTDPMVVDVAALVDPDADRILFWDDSAGEFLWLTVGTGLTISGATLTADEASASEIWIGSETGKYVSPDKFRTATAPATITSASASTAVDFEAGRNFTLTLDEDTTIANPTNVQAGDSGVLYIIQDGTGGWTPGFASNWKAVGV